MCSSLQAQRHRGIIRLGRAPPRGAHHRISVSYLHYRGPRSPARCCAAAACSWRCSAAPACRLHPFVITSNVRIRYTYSVFHIINLLFSYIMFLVSFFNFFLFCCSCRFCCRCWFWLVVGFGWLLVLVLVVLRCCRLCCICVSLFCVLSSFFKYIITYIC